MLTVAEAKAGKIPDVEVELAYQRRGAALVTWCRSRLASITFVFRVPSATQARSQALRASSSRRRTQRRLAGTYRHAGISTCRTPEII